MFLTSTETASTKAFFFLKLAQTVACSVDFSLLLPRACARFAKNLFLSGAKMGIKKPTRCTGLSSKQKKKKQISKCNSPQKVSSVKQEENSKARVIAQEIKFARLLASKEKKVRDKVLKKLKNWLTVRAQSSFGKFFLYFR